MAVTDELLARMKHYTTGIDQVDAEHVAILSLADDLPRLSGSALLDALYHLGRMWEAHAAVEDRLMAEGWYPYATEHRDAHKMITHYFNTLPVTYGNTPTHKARDILQHMLQHIDTFDMKMGELLVKNNASLAEGAGSVIRKPNQPT